MHDKGPSSHQRFFPDQNMGLTLDCLHAHGHMARYLCRSSFSAWACHVTGAQPFPVQLLSQLVRYAAEDLSRSTGVPDGDLYADQERPINQQLYAATFGQFLQQLPSASNATIQEAFAEEIYKQMYQRTFSGNFQPELTPSVMALADAAGFDNAIAAGFLLVGTLLVLSTHTLMCSMDGTVTY